MHMEFDSDETIDHFNTPWWNSFHSAVDAPGSSQAHAAIDNHRMIAIGLLGLDCAHSCSSELHPLFALAIQTADSPDPNDDTWAIFVRNWGNEGYCSSGLETLDRRTVTMVIPAPPHANGVSMGPGTQFLFGPDDMSSLEKAAVSGPFLDFDPAQGALVTFTLPPPDSGARINGEIHLRWRFGQPSMMMAAKIWMRQKPGAQLMAAAATRIETDAEELAEETYQRLSPKQKLLFHKLSRDIAARPDRTRLRPPTNSHFRGQRLAATEQVFTHKPDPKRNERVRRRQAALRAAIDAPTP
jgi:hypothetical protein